MVILLDAHNLSVDDLKDPVRVGRQIVVVGNHHKRLLLLPHDLLHKFQHFHRRLRIQISCRLIRKDDLRVHRQCPCDSDSLLLSAGHLVRHVGHKFLQSHKL